MEQTKIFVGSAKIITTKYGEMTKLSFSKKDVETLLDNLNEKGWVNCNIKEKQNKVEGKPTHYLEIDTFVSNKSSDEQYKDDLPF